MATQGIVSVCSGGRVLMKVVAGCDGYNAEKLAGLLKERWPVDVDQAYEAAMQVDFGVESSLVVMTEDEVRFDGDEDLHPRYRETFSQPEFNPRWEYGVADYVVVVDV